MRKSSLFALALLLPLAALAQAEPPAGPATKISVVPFASLGGDLPPRAGAKAAGMLSTELKNTDGLELVDARKAAPPDPHQEGLARARKQVEEAKALRAKRKFRLAEELLVKALAEYRASAAGLTEVGELVDAFALLSAVQYNTGRDEEGLKSLTTALALAPDRELPLAATSPLFARVVAENRKAVQSGPKGSLLVESTPSGAPVTLDGVALGGSPLQIKNVPVGLHVWRVALPSGEAQGGVTEIAAGKPAKVSVQTTTKDPESRILAALSQNKLDSDLLAAAKEQAAATKVDALLIGALSREGKGLGLDAFFFSAAKGELRRLPHLKFDAELLSAGMELFNLATAVKEKGILAGEAAKVPGAVSPTAGAAGTKVAEAVYGQQQKKDAAAELEPEPVKEEEAAGKKPLEPQKRVPLKKNK